MAKTTRPLAVGVVIVALILAADPVDATDAQGMIKAEVPVASMSPRVRTDDPALATLIQAATDRSPTFRHLAEAIQATDGVVYVQRGRCGHAVRACLPFSVAVAGPHRVLRVLVEDLEPEAEVIGSIAHELWHALEVLDQPGITTGRAMFFFYKSHGSWRGSRFETTAAIVAGNAVRQELRKRRPGQVK